MKWGHKYPIDTFLDLEPVDILYWLGTTKTGQPPIPDGPENA
jgi:hypothetical protein